MALYRQACVGDMLKKEALPKIEAEPLIKKEADYESDLIANTVELWKQWKPKN